MVLSQEEADGFLAAEKRVSGKTMAWAEKGSNRRLWRAPVEVGGVRIGEVCLVCNTALVRHCNFMLILRGIEVYRIDARPSMGRHRNWGCPACFPGKVVAREHEHVYVEGSGCRCARALPEADGASDSTIVEIFCKRARLDFEPPYTSPFLYSQVPLL